MQGGSIEMRFILSKEEAIIIFWGLDLIKTKYFRVMCSHGKNVPAELKEKFKEIVKVYERFRPDCLTDSGDFNE